jgi:hypothetical protein
MQAVEDAEELTTILSSRKIELAAKIDTTQLAKAVEIPTEEIRQIRPDSFLNPR